METKLAIGETIPTDDGGNCTVVSIDVFMAPELDGSPIVESYVCVHNETGEDYITTYNRLTEKFIFGFLK